MVFRTSRTACQVWLAINAALGRKHLIEIMSFCDEIFKDSSDPSHFYLWNQCRKESDPTREFLDGLKINRRWDHSI